MRIAVLDTNHSFIKHFKRLVAPQYPDVVFNYFEDKFDDVNFGTYNAVLLDVNLGLCNGYDLCKRIKDFLPDVKVVICSGVIEDIKGWAFLKSNADDIVAKSTECARISKKVGELCQSMTVAQS